MHFLELWKAMLLCCSPTKRTSAKLLWTTTIRWCLSSTRLAVLVPLISTFAPAWSTGRTSWHKRFTSNSIALHSFLWYFPLDGLEGHHDYYFYYLLFALGRLLTRDTKRKSSSITTLSLLMVWLSTGSTPICIGLIRGLTQSVCPTWMATWLPPSLPIAWRNLGPLPYIHPKGNFHLEIKSIFKNLFLRGMGLIFQVDVLVRLGRKASHRAGRNGWVPPVSHHQRDCPMA